MWVRTHTGDLVNVAHATGLAARPANPRRPDGDWILWAEFRRGEEARIALRRYPIADEDGVRGEVRARGALDRLAERLGLDPVVVP